MHEDVNNNDDANTATRHLWKGVDPVPPGGSVYTA